METFAQLEERSTDDRRGAARRRLRLRSRGSTLSSPQTDVIIHDLSERGLLIETAADLSVGEHLEINIPEAGAVDTTVMWNDGRYFGCKFREPIATAALSASLLQSPGYSAEKISPDAISFVSAALRELRALSCRVDSISEQLERALDELSNKGHGSHNS